MSLAHGFVVALEKFDTGWNTSAVISDWRVEITVVRNLHRIKTTFLES
jgi:hypothetical protein